MFVGYDDARNAAWRFYDPGTRKVLTSHDATFYETHFTVAAGVMLEEKASIDGDEEENDSEWLTTLHVRWRDAPNAARIA